MLVRSAAPVLLMLSVWALLGLPHEAVAAAPEQQIIAAGDHASMNGPTEYFTGQVRIDPLWPADTGISATGGLVTLKSNHDR